MAPGGARGIRGSEDLGYWVGELPVGCRLCMAGAKSVLFATGLCPEGCYYCPVSPQRRGRDVVYVNDVEVGEPGDVLREVADSMSEGIGITGGEPLLALDRVVEILRLLKEVFGEGFHAHLYTSGTRLDERALEILVDAGLDELRVHVIGARSLEAVKLALGFPVDVVVENPAVPGEVEELRGLISRLAELGVRYVNLNEMEFSESNAHSLALRGFRASGDGRSALGSREVALGILRWVEEGGIGVSVHFCPAIYKDVHQYPRRLNRRALATRRVFEEVEGGVVRWAEAECSGELWRLALAGLAFRVGEACYTHPRLAGALRVGTLVEALPLTPRRVLNEYPVVE